MRRIESFTAFARPPSPVSGFGWGLFCAWLAVSASGSLAGHDASTPDEIVRNWQRSTLLTRSCAYRSERVLSFPRIGSGPQRAQVQVSHVWRDGNERFKSIRMQWSGPSASRIDRRPERAGTYTTLLDPEGDPYQAYVLRQFFWNGKQHVALQVFPDLSFFQGSRFSDCAVLDGRLSTGQRAAADVLLEEGELALQKVIEEIDGRPCHIVTATSQYGTMKLWFDPARGYGLARAEVSKRDGDRFSDTEAFPTLLPFLTEGDREHRRAVGSDTIIDCVTFTQTDGHWIADGARVRETYLFEGGATQTYETTWKRTDIVLDPDFAEMHAFQIEIPEGVPVSFSGSGGVRHVWRNGKAVPFVEPEVMDALDEAIRTLTTAPATQPPASPTSQPAR